MARFEGDDNDNQIPQSGQSNAGDDVMYGRGGDDHIEGGSGNDYVVGGAGADDLYGGIGIDTISYWDANGAGVVINLTTMKASGAGSEAHGDSISGFENIEGVNHDQGHDILTGSAVANRIDGMGGNDRIDGMGGDDRLYGGTGNDVIAGGSGNDYIEDLDQNNTLSGGDGDDRILAGGYNDTADGGAGNDWLSCDRGSYIEDEVNVLRGGAGADRIIGSAAKNDTATYSEGTLGVAINLTAGTASGGNAQGDVLSGIEHLIGSAGNDRLTGDTGANSLAGGNGNDVLSGMDGADRLDGGAGTDTLAGDFGADTLYGGAGNDTLDGGLSNDRLSGGAGTDRLTGGAGADQFVFAAASESSLAARDVITDFSHAQGDKINLALIDANTQLAGDQAFKFIGTAAYSHHAGELRFAVSGNITVVAGDVNGDGTSDFQIALANHPALVTGDFAL